MSLFSQSEIDASAPNVVLRNNPGGGSGADYTATCTILEDENNIGHPLLWQSGDDETAEGFEKHQIGVTCAPDERFSYIVCTEKTNYSLTPTTFSEVSDEIIIHRVFCAALRPTNTDFTFSNPIKNVTVSASADTVNLQAVALDEYQTVTTANSITVTHAQDFPCVFGIIYKHKSKGEVAETSPSPQPTTEEKKVTVHFHAPELLNSFEKCIIFSNTPGQYFKITDMALRNCSETNAGYVVNLVIDTPPERSYIIRPSDSLMILDSGFLHQKFIERKPDGLRCGSEIYVILTTTEANEGFDLELKYIQL